MTGVIAKPAPLYQGRDWVTSRLTMAEAFDTLERIHDLCLGIDLQKPDEKVETFGILRAVHGLTESLTAQCAVAVADTIAPAAATGSFEQLWNGFEVEWLLRDMKAKAIDLYSEESFKPYGTLALLANRLKSALKKMDQ